MSAKTLDDMRQYAYRKRPLHEIYPELVDVPEVFLLEWFKDRYDYVRLHTNEELGRMKAIPPEALLQWLEEAGEFVWAAKHQEWEEQRRKNRCGGVNAD
ncbi:MAG: hypothetical protein AB1515_01485 [Nitrospirota bacterium]